MVECPRCNGQGYIYKGLIRNELTLYICDECDACWEKGEEIINDNFKDLTTYLATIAINYNQEEIQDLEYI